jgi:hypothetical protein
MLPYAIGALEAIRTGLVQQMHRSYFVPLTPWKGVAGAIAFQAGQSIPDEVWPVILAFANLISLPILQSVLADEVRRELQGTE